MDIRGPCCCRFAISGAKCYGLCVGGWNGFSCMTVILFANDTWNYHDRLDSQGKYNWPYDDEVLGKFKFT